MKKLILIFVTVLFCNLGFSQQMGIRAPKWDKSSPLCYEAAS